MAGETIKYLDYEGLQEYTDNIVGKIDSKVPTTRKVNNKALSADITLAASDVGAAADDIIAVQSTEPTSSSTLIWIQV